MVVLGIIFARAGSKGLPDKCVRDLLGRPVIDYTLDHAAASRRLSAVVLTTDSEPAKALARARGIEIIDRPAELAGDTATIDAAARHAVERWESAHARTVDAVALLYGNIPVRAAGLIDRAIERLETAGADSVRSVAPVTKQHPDWVHRLDGDRMTQYRKNGIYRRQDLEPVYYHDGAVVTVTRDALFAALATPEDHQAFLGADRRALVQRPDEAVDIDEPIDLLLAEALLRASGTRPSAGGASRACEHSSLPLGGIKGGPGLRVGPGCRTFVIAEAGVNHDGDLEKARRLIDVAADCGADAVKFQMFRAADLVTEDAATAEYQQQGCGARSQRDMLQRLELSDEAFRVLAEHCRERSILFLATPFSVGDAQRLTALGVPAIKIASTDLTNSPLLDAAAATGASLILSTGASTVEEIEASVERLIETAGRERIALLHCVSCYPTPVEAIHLRAIALLADRFGVPCGLSDHTLSTRMGGLAVAAGAALVEKHFTLDRGAEGPDHAMSLAPSQLADYIAGIREAEQALGDGRLGMTELEREVRSVAARSIVSRAAPTAGTRLTADMLTLKRPGTGLPPAVLPQLIGRRTRVDLPRDALLTWDVLE